MKKTILFFALFISFAAFAQFPGNKPELIIGHEVKVRPLWDYEAEINNGYKEFYSDSNVTKIYMPSIENEYSTATDALEGHILKVVNVEFLRKSSMYVYYKITLQDKEQLIYHEYRLNSIPYLEPINFTLPADYYCDYISKDELGSDITYSTETTNYFKLYKHITKSRGVQYNLLLYVQIEGIGPDSGTVTLLLDNGKKLAYPKSKFSFHAGKAYASMITLSNTDIQALTENNIKEVYFDSSKADLSPYSENLKGILKCLITKK